MGRGGGCGSVVVSSGMSRVEGSRYSPRASQTRPWVTLGVEVGKLVQLLRPQMWLPGCAERPLAPSAPSEGWGW